MSQTSDLTPRATVRARINRQYALFVVAPLAVALIAVIVLAALARLALPAEGVGSTAVWSQIATIYLVLLTCGGLLLALALPVGLSIGLVWLMRRLPPIFGRVDGLLTKVSARINRLAQKPVDGVIRLSAGAAWVSGFARSVYAAFGPGPRRP